MKIGAAIAQVPVSGEDAAREAPGPVVFPILVAAGTGLLLALVPPVVLAIEGTPASVFVLESLAPGPDECGWAALPAAFEIFVLGLVAGPLAWIELVAARRRPTLTRDLVATFAAVLATAVTFAVAELEVCYVMIQVWTGSLSKMVQGSSSGLLQFFAAEVRDTYPFFPALAVPLLLGMRLRLRALPPWQVVSVGALGSSVLPAAAWILTGYDRTLLRYVFFMGALGAIAPLVHLAAARLERGITRER